MRNKSKNFSLRRSVAFAVDHNYSKTFNWLSECVSCEMCLFRAALCEANLSLDSNFSSLSCDQRKKKINLWENFSGFNVLLIALSF